MRSRVELVIEVEHPESVDPTNAFVWYFTEEQVFDQRNMLHVFEVEDIHVISEEWSNV